jgi:hypothetical protein
MSTNSDTALKRGELAFQAGDFESVLACFADATSLDPRSAAAHCALGRAYERRGSTKRCRVLRRLAVGILACLLAARAGAQPLDREKVNSAEGYFMLSGVPMDRNGKDVVVHIVLTGTHGSDSMLGRLHEFAGLEELHLEDVTGTEEGLQRLGQLRQLKKLALACCGSDATLAVLSQLPKLESLSLQGAAFSGKGLRHIAAIPALKSLTLESSCSDSIHGLAWLKSSPKLEELHIIGARLDNAGLDGIEKCSRLKVLSIFGCAATDADMERIASLTQLEVLSMERAGIHSKGLIRLKTLTKLRALSISLGDFVGGEIISDEALGVIAHLPQLKKLALVETTLTKNGIEQLEKLSELQELSLVKTNVSAESVKKIRKALPNCKISEER